MPLPLPPEVPAYVRHEDSVQNHVQVKGGTNWDFSRTAVTTPITQLEAQKPVELPTAPAYASTVEQPTGATLKFDGDKTRLNPAMKGVIKSLSKSSAYSVKAHANHPSAATVAVTASREKHVKDYMKSRGYKVTEPGKKAGSAQQLDKSGTVEIKPQ